MNFNKLAEENNWEINKRILYGERYGFLLTMAQDDVNVSAFIPVVGTTVEQRQKVLDDLNFRNNELKTTFAFDNSVLFFRMTKFESDETITDTLYEVFSYLRNNLEYKKVCLYCGKDNTDSYNYIRGIKYYAHPECIPQKSVQETSQEYENPKYFQGAIGALLGGLVGTLPWIIVSSVGFYAAILGYVIGLSAFYGYRQLGGKLGPATRYLILFSVIIAVFVGEVANVAVEFYQSQVSFNLDNIIYNIQYHNLLKDILINLGLGLLMALLGIRGLFKRLKVQ